VDKIFFFFLFLLVTPFCKTTCCHKRRQYRLHRALPETWTRLRHQQGLGLGDMVVRSTNNKVNPEQKCAWNLG
jgi:hypothetical protein